MARPTATSPQRIAAAEKRWKALELRKAGKTFRQIAQELGFKNPSGAFNAVDTALRETAREAAEDVRKLELDRLDAVMHAIWSRVLQGELAALDRFLRIQDRRAKYLGLDSPTQISVISEDALTSELRRLEAEVAGMQSDTDTSPVHQ